MAANHAHLPFCSVSEAELRRWVEANPGRVNDQDSRGGSPLGAAVKNVESMPLILWLVDEKGADVNADDWFGYAPLHFAKSLEVLNALLDCGADPTLLDSDGSTPLMVQIVNENYDLVVRLLQDPRVQATINVQDSGGNTALMYACSRVEEPEVPAIVQALLQAGADLALKNTGGLTPLTALQNRHASHPTTLALVQRNLDAEKASFLVKTRRLVMAATRSPVPSFLQGRVACGLPLPRVALAPVPETESDEVDEEARSKLRTALAFLVGMEGGGMPRDVFRVVLDLLMPFWDPSRRKVRSATPSGVGAVVGAAAVEEAAAAEHGTSAEQAAGSNSSNSSSSSSSSGASSLAATEAVAAAVASTTTAGSSSSSSSSITFLAPFATSVAALNL